MNGTEVAEWRRDLREKIGNYPLWLLTAELERWEAYVNLKIRYENFPQFRSNDLARLRMLKHEAGKRARA